MRIRLEGDLQALEVEVDRSQVDTVCIWVSRFFCTLIMHDQSLTSLLVYGLQVKAQRESNRAHEDLRAERDLFAIKGLVSTLGIIWFPIPIPSHLALMAFLIA